MLFYISFDFFNNNCLMFLLAGIVINYDLKKVLCVCVCVCVCVNNCYKDNNFNFFGKLVM